MRVRRVRNGKVSQLIVLCGDRRGQLASAVCPVGARVETNAGGHPCRAWAVRAAVVALAQRIRGRRVAVSHRGYAAGRGGAYVVAGRPAKGVRHRRARLYRLRERRCKSDELARRAVAGCALLPCGVGASRRARPSAGAPAVGDDRAAALCAVARLVTDRAALKRLSDAHGADGAGGDRKDGWRRRRRRGWRRWARPRQQRGWRRLARRARW